MSAVITRACEECGDDVPPPGLLPANPGGLCDRCTVTDPAAELAGHLEPGGRGKGPVLRVGSRRIPWNLIGEVLAGEGGVNLTLTITSAGDPSGDEVVVYHGAPDLRPRPPLRPAVDGSEAEAWEEAVTLLGERLGTGCHPCPAPALHDACGRARTAALSGEEPWPVVADAAGWGAGPPPDDVDLWTGAAMALVSVAVDGVDADTAECLDGMELNDWLAAILELVRSGPGSRADPQNLVLLSAHCLDIDSAAVDPDLVPLMVASFTALHAVWRALGAVDDAGRLTPLGAWGLPVALARAWGGWIDSPVA